MAAGPWNYGPWSEDHQLALPQKQAQAGAGTFARPGWRIHGDTAATIDGSPVAAVSNPSGWHKFTRKGNIGLQANDKMHYVWQAMASDKMWGP